MSTAETRQGRDGRHYPAQALTRQERGDAIRLSHKLVCEQRMSIRAAQQAMAESGIRRSRGTIAADVADYECFSPVNKGRSVYGPGWRTCSGAAPVSCLSAG